MVTGGCGFIGSHLVRSLIREGHTVRVLDDLSTGKKAKLPPGVELVVGDVANGVVTDRCMQGVDGCYHLAAVASVQRSIEAWQETHRTNMSGTIAVLNAARGSEDRRNIPVVFASSAAVYGANKNVPLVEGASVEPLSAYGADKLGCELHGAVAASAFGMQVTAFRFFNVYGPGQDPSSPYSGVVSIFVRRMIERKPITIFGDGKQTRDFVFVSDVVNALKSGMEFNKLGFRVYNVCTGKGSSLLEIIDTLESITARKNVVLFSQERNGEVRDSIGDPSSLRDELGVEAQISLSQGLSTLFAEEFC